MNDGGCNFCYFEIEHLFEAGKLCMGTVTRYRASDKAAKPCIYTRDGTKEASHVERSCITCGTGYWHRYWTEVYIIYGEYIASCPVQ